MTSSGYSFSRQGSASADCRSVHSHGSMSAWESVIGHDDPTVPINNCKEDQALDIPDSATIDSFVTQPEENRDVCETFSDKEPSERSERKGLRDQLTELDKTEKDWQDKLSQPERSHNTRATRECSSETVNESKDTSTRSEKLQLLEIHSIDENEALDIVAEDRQPPSPNEANNEEPSNGITTNEIVRQVQKRLSKNEHLTPKRNFFEENFKDVEQGQHQELALVSPEQQGDNEKKSDICIEDPDESTWKIDLDNLEGDFEQADGVSQINNRSMDDDSTIQEKKTWAAAWARWIVLAIALLLVLSIAIAAIMSKKGESEANVAKDGQLDVVLPTPVASSEMPTSAPSTKMPTKLPTLSPTRLLSHAPSENDPILSQLQILSGNALVEHDSVQNMAYTWLLEDDQAKGDLMTLEPDHIIQRYVCALLYFALNGENWYSQLNFLASDSVCEWNDGNGNGVYCNGFGNVSRITISANNLGGKLSPEIGSLPFLKELRLRGNSIVGQMPIALSNLHELQMLELSSNDLTGPIPEFSPLQNDLYHLSINDNRLSGNIPKSIGSLQGLLYLDIHNNVLSGSLPLSLGLLPRLVTFYASKNQLTGAIPEFEDNLGLLQVLDLSNNEISGQLDHLFSADGPKRLAEVNLDSNGLTGTLPSSLDSYTFLTSISMAHNQFSGLLTPEFSGMKRLKRLLLNHNNFSGSVPNGLAGLGSLAELRVDHNQFDGDLDEHFCSPSNALTLTTFAADCRAEDPAVTCSCCTSCCHASLGCVDV
ncbi:unnamed protein product [Cylindrotheca closterium]|uniref:Leucine-rich repeat-containing N-terminal plant-type domain-containing protein n=1 Tax=Cylindrotheca closterium TaxID=2856 RepID=A0AAD2CTA4_9STRA|nr:unnamed protein product [Cylindrotheca closterium]